MVNDPTPNWIIETLGTSHELSAFDCGETSLNEFLRKYAKQHRKRGLAQTFVALVPPNRQVVGYYSLASAQVSPDRLTQGQARGLPRAIPIPVVLLARLAVTANMQGKGLGQYLLMDSLYRVVELSDQIGVAAMAVHAISESARRFYDHFGFQSLQDNQRQMFLSLKDMKRLFPA